MRLAPLFALATAGCFAAPGPATAETRTYELPPFDSVSVSSGLTAIVDVGGPQSVRAEAPSESILDQLKVDVRNGRLELGLETGIVQWLFGPGQQQPFVIHVSAPEIKAAEASSGADVEVNGMAGETLSLGASSGAALAATGTSGGNVSLDVSSGADLKVAGKCATLTAGASSGATLEARDLLCEEVNADLSSGAHAEVHAQQAIGADASSGAGIVVHGSPADVEIDTSSGGSVDFAS